jgi:hypothetical protein
MRVSELIAVVALASATLASAARAQPPVTGDTTPPVQGATPPVLQDTVPPVPTVSQPVNSVDAVNPSVPTPATPAAERAPIRPGELKLAFDREVYRYPGENRRDPFRSLTGENAAGPLFEELILRMILYSPAPGQSIVVIADGAQKLHRLRRGESVGSITVSSISATDVTFTVNDFGVPRQEVLTLKKDNSKEGA